MKPPTESNMSSPMVVGVDIGKEVFHLVGFAADGKIAFRRRIRRLALKDAFEKLPPCVVGMEACLSAHFVSRTLRALGHQPRIIPAIYVKPFVKGQKNDYNDAEAIAEAALRPNLRFVQEKSEDQLEESVAVDDRRWELALGSGLYGALVVKPDDAHCIFSRCRVSVLAKAVPDDPRGARQRARKIALHTCIRQVRVDLDHDAVMRIGGKAPRRQAHSLRRRASHA